MSHTVIEKTNLASRLVEGFEVAPVPIEEAKEIQQIIDRLGVNQEEFARLIKASGPSVSRWLRGAARPSVRMAEKFGRVKVVLDILDPAIAKADLKRFFGRPNTQLRGHRPIDLLDTDHGLETVKDLIEAAFTGSFA